MILNLPRSAHFGNAAQDGEKPTSAETRCLRILSLSLLRQTRVVVICRVTWRVNSGDQGVHRWPGSASRCETILCPARDGITTQSLRCASPEDRRFPDSEWTRLELLRYVMIRFAEQTGRKSPGRFLQKRKSASKYIWPKFPSLAIAFVFVLSFIFF